MLIKQYDTENFRKQFTYPNAMLDRAFKDGYNRFFCIKIENVSPYTKTPVPPVKEYSHSLMYISEGTFEIFKGNKKFTIGKKEGIAIPAGEIFSFETVSKEVKGYNIHFHPDLLYDDKSASDLLTRFSFLLPYSNETFHFKQNDGAVVNLFERLYQIYGESGLKKPELIKSYVYTILSEYSASTFFLGNQATQKYQVLTNGFKRLLFENFKKQRTVSFYSSALGISPNHLNKVLRTTTGKSTIAWIHEAIVLEAKYLLGQTRMQINEIAYELGVEDSSYFTRLFKKSVGLTPLGYREKVIEKS